METRGIVAVVAVVPLVAMLVFTEVTAVLANLPADAIPALARCGAACAVLGALLVAGVMAVLNPATPKPSGALLETPATSWPAGKPVCSDSAAYPTYDTTDPKGSFTKICDMLIDELAAELPVAYELPARETKWVRDMLEYNCKGGKMNRGLMVVETGIEIFKARGLPVNNTDLCRFAVLGWCIEWLQAWLLVADDMMDDSITRRGQPCWYRQPHVGKIAMNDAVTIEALVFKVLKRHFSALPCYMQLVDLMLETTLQTEMGQLLDTLCVNIELADFTVDRWTAIVKYKTAFYSFYLPVAMGMIYAGISDVSSYDTAREVLMIMGIYFQAQDDFLDCYGTPEEIGKIGTDIQDKKCGWLFTHAYHELANAEQKELLDKTYGKCKVNTKEEQEIKKLYTALKLKEKYAEYEQGSYDKIMALKPRVEGSGVPWSVFEKFLLKVYKRKK